MKKLIISLFFILIISCSSQDSLDVNSANEQGILLLDNGTEPQGLDPHIVTGVTEHKIVIALFEGLTMQNPKGEGVIPAAAESWEISNDGTEIIFKIRPDAKWSNGDPLTAQDFVYSWKRILTPALGSRYPDMLYAVKNAEQFNKSEIEDFDLVGVKAEDSKTLKVTLKTKTPFFLKQLASEKSDYHSYWDKWMDKIFVNYLENNDKSDEIFMKIAEKLNGEEFCSFMMGHANFVTKLKIIFAMPKIGFIKSYLGAILN